MNKVQFNKVLKELIKKSKNNCLIKDELCLIKDELCLIKDELCLMITCNAKVCFR